MNKLHFFIILSLLLSLIFCEKAIVSKYTVGNPDVNKNPTQLKINDIDPIKITNDFGEFLLTPVADYSISARVVSSKSYSRKWTSSLSPMDLALVWGKLSDREIDNFIKYSQKNRWYYYKYSGDFPFDKNYIISHSSNNHIIPSSYNLSIALKEIKKNDLIKIKGYLVTISGFSKGRKVFWGTSTTRTDSGDRSCELIYAKKIRINNRIFR